MSHYFFDILCIQEVVTQVIQYNLLYEMGCYFLDTQYSIKLVWQHLFTPKLISKNCNLPVREHGEIRYILYCNPRGLYFKKAKGKLRQNWFIYTRTKRVYGLDKASWTYLVLYVQEVVTHLIYYWVTQKLLQIYTANHLTFPIQIRKITVQICGNFWVTLQRR